MVNMLVISPLSNKLFQRAIILDSSALNPMIPTGNNYMPIVKFWGIYIFNGLY